ncbi:hypothetical protein [Stappia sp.]|uniref:hypothetical protein n=1 Tax=Stappia sp. TaxID=1870903 RepID=UPI0032D8B8A4
MRRWTAIGALAVLATFGHAREAPAQTENESATQIVSIDTVQLRQELREVIPRSMPYQECGDRMTLSGVSIDRSLLDDEVDTSAEVEQTLEICPFIVYERWFCNKGTYGLSSSLFGQALVQGRDLMKTRIAQEHSKVCFATRFRPTPDGAGVAANVELVSSAFSPTVTSLIERSRLLEKLEALIAAEFRDTIAAALPESRIPVAELRLDFETPWVILLEVSRSGAEP